MWWYISATGTTKILPNIETQAAERITFPAPPASATGKAA